MKKIFDLFWAKTIISGEDIFLTQTEKKYAKALFLVRIFYALLFVISLQGFLNFSQAPAFTEVLNSEQLFIPLWPVRWLSLLEWKPTVTVIFFLFPASAFSAMCIGLRFRLIRIFVFIVLFVYVSLISSFGKTDHDLHLFIVAAFLFIFLPDEDQKNNESKIIFLKFFWGLQLFILATYTSSALFKFGGLFYQLHLGQISALSPEAIARQAGASEFISNHKTISGDFVIKNCGPVFSFLLLSSYFIELFSLFIAFRPSLHKLWGTLLMLLHVIIFLIIGPNFIMQLLLIFIIIYLSPFHKQKEKFKKRIRQKSLALD